MEILTSTLEALRHWYFDGRVGNAGGSGSFQPSHLLLIREHGLLQRDAELLTYRLELLEVLCVLALVLDLELDTCCVLVIMMLSVAECDSIITEQAFRWRGSCA
jgi:hypothetical protein